MRNVIKRKVILIAYKLGLYKFKINEIDKLSSNNLAFVEYYSIEYLLMWENLKKRKEYSKPINGENWQYMTSFKHNDIYYHNFRHRKHPLTKNRMTINIKASDNFKIN